MQGILRLTILSIAVFACVITKAQKVDSLSNAPIINIAEQKGVPVTGVITDAATKKPLPGINISLPGYSAALTDDNGKFTIRVPDYRVTLLIKSEGYQSKEIALKGQSKVDASLYEEGFTSIYDNVNLPMGIRSLNQTVNAVGSVNTEGNWHRNTETPDSYLQGKIAGLHPVMRSGTPNAGAYMILR